MQKHFVLSALIILFFISCTAFFNFDEQNISHLDKDGNVIKDGQGNDYISNTKVIFINPTDNYKAEIFSTHTRGSRITTLAAGQRTPEVSWFVSDNYPFYLTFHLNLAGTEIPFIPTRFQLDYVSAPIIKDQVTEITIRSLNSIANEVLFNEVHIALKNSYGTSIEFSVGNSILTPINSTNISVANNSTVIYRVNPTSNISTYAVRAGQPIPLNLIDGLTELKTGWFYEIELSGGGPTRTLALISEPRELTLANLN